MGHIEEKASSRKSHFLKNATELLLAGLVVVITALLRAVVDELVEAEEVWLRGAVNVVPPVTDEILLIEDGSIGAKEGCGAAVLLAHIERLAVGRCVLVDAGQVLLLPTIETSLRHFCEHRVVRSCFSRNWIHHHLSIRTNHVLQGDPHAQRSEVGEAIGEALNRCPLHLSTWEAEIIQCGQKPSEIQRA